MYSVKHNWQTTGELMSASEDAVVERHLSLEHAQSLRTTMIRDGYNPPPVTTTGSTVRRVFIDPCDCAHCS